MRDSAQELPSLRSLQGALESTTERLAGELARPQAAAPDWSQLEWRVGRAAAAIHGVGALLGQRLRWRGPGQWPAYLARQQHETAARGQRIGALLARLDAQGRERGIALVALKGAALHRRGVYCSGERPMADVDLLVRVADEARACELIASLGYRPGPVTWKHRVFEPVAAASLTTLLGEDCGNPIRIELHTHVHERLPVSCVDLSALMWSAAPAPGIADYPSDPMLALHLLLHAAGSLTDHSVRLLHLYDLARLSTPFTGADWEALLDAAARVGAAWWLYPPLALTQRYFASVPAGVLEHCARVCPRRLRRSFERVTVSEVSLSDLWVRAFPGLIWAHTPAEALRYVGARLRPPADTRALRQSLAGSHPLLHGGTWAHASQLRRILRWLRARQPRQESLVVVQAALTAAG